MGQYLQYTSILRLLVISSSYPIKTVELPLFSRRFSPIVGCLYLPFQLFNFLVYIKDREEREESITSVGISGAIGEIIAVSAGEIVSVFIEYAYPSPAVLAIFVPRTNEPVAFATETARGCRKRDFIVEVFLLARVPVRLSVMDAEVIFVVHHGYLYSYAAFVFRPPVCPSNGS